LWQNSGLENGRVGAHILNMTRDQLFEKLINVALMLLALAAVLGLSYFFEY
jgi:hypothetical protein